MSEGYRTRMDQVYMTPKRGVVLYDDGKTYRHGDEVPEGCPLLDSRRDSMQERSRDSGVEPVVKAARKVAKARASKKPVDDADDKEEAG